MEILKPTFDHLIRIWWSLFWRNLLCILLSVMAGGILGFIIGFILGILGVDVLVVKVVCGAVGFILGLGVSLIPVWLILNKDYGEFRLAVIPKEDRG